MVGRARRGDGDDDGWLHRPAYDTARGSPAPDRRRAGRWGPYDSATARLEPDGRLALYVGLSPHGQGLETSLAQVAADHLRVTPDEVEVEAATGAVRIPRYAVAHDCGTVINPLIVEGQIHGGVAQGIGGAAIGAPAASANAVADALAPFGAHVTRTPLTPARILALMGEAP
jgi:CO/xanthine dehydrogenase Mo-binding subunit